MKQLAILLMGLWLVVPAGAQQSDGVDIALEVYDPVDFPPHFPNGLNQGMDKFLAKHFFYPEEAWRTKRVTETKVSFIIRKDGSLCSVETPEGLHPALSEALKTTLPKMPLWFPGYRNTQKTDARVGCTVSLVDRRTGMPYHLRAQMEKTARYTDMLHPATLSTSQMAMAAEELKAVASFYPEHKNTAVSLTRMYVSMGKTDEAVALIDRAARGYSRLNLWRDAQAARLMVYRPGYNGRSEIALLLQLGLTLEQANRGERAHRVYEQAISLIDEKLKTHDIGSPSVKEGDEEDLFWKGESLLEQLQYRLKYTDATQLTEEDWARLTTVQQNAANLIPIVEQFVAEGKISEHSRTASVLRQLKGVQTEMATGKVTTKDLRSLAGIKAFAVYLNGGLSAARQFLAQSVGGKQDDNVEKSYYAKLGRRLQEHSAALSDREKAVHAMATYPDGTAAAILKQLHEVFPLDWIEQ